MTMEGFLDDEDEAPQLPPSKYTLNRSICPYVCSTPEDFNEERQFLAEKIFPQINELCSERGGNFLPVDIKWSALDDQVATGHLLKLNLDLISKCSPFFICLLGETYGPYRSVESPKLPTKVTTLLEPATWIDKNYMVAASAGYTWVLQEAHQNTSLTELEIIQAAFLSNSKHCHFYFRQPEHLDEKMGHFTEEVRQQKSKIYKPQNEYADLNIRDLKQRIVKKGMSVKYFKTLNELGLHVLKDWTAILDIVYPPLIQEQGYFEAEEYKEWVANEIFAESRRKVFVTSPEMRSLMEEITNFAKTASDEPPMEPEEQLDRYKSYSVVTLLKKKNPVEIKYKSAMLIHGDRGCGKSTLVANWIPKFMLEYQDIKVLSLFVGSSCRSTDLSVFLRYCIKELREEYLRPDAAVDVPRVTDSDQPWSFQEVCQAFISALSLGPCVIIIDGFDELGSTLGVGDRQLKELRWLPVPLPPQCRIIFTTCRSHLSYHAIGSRRDTILHAMPLLNTHKIRTDFLEDHMQQHFIHLSKDSLETINDMKSSHKALFMNILCNEMQTFNVYMNLNDFLETIFDKCQSLRDLCVRCFQRWTKDYSWQKENLYGDAPDAEAELEFDGWVPDILRLLAVAKTGLTQDEIFQLLGKMGYTGNRTVKNFDWLQFRVCLGNLVYENTDGHILYSHQHFKEIVEYILLRGAKKTDNKKNQRYTLNSFKSGGSEIISTKSDNDQNWKEQKKKFHKNLANHFIDRPFSQRKLMELPWQLMHAGEFKKLVKVLTSTEMIDGFLDDKRQCPSNKVDLAFYWEVLKDQGYDVVPTYSKLLQSLGILESEEAHIDCMIEQLEDTVSMNTDAGEDDAMDDDISAKPVVTLIVPRIITSSPKDRTLSVIEEAPSVADSYAPFSMQPSEDGELDHDRKGSISKMSVMSAMSEYSDTQEELDTIFLTEGKQNRELFHRVPSVVKDIVLTTQIAHTTFLLARFMKDIGHPEVTENILVSLSNKFDKNYPLSEDDKFLHAKIQEELGKFSQSHGDLAQTEKWFRRSLRTVMDMASFEDDSPYAMDILNLKGRLLNHHGYLRMREGFLDSAEDLLKEGLEDVTVCRNLTDRATTLYNLGLLRIQQEDFLLAESNLRQSLRIREQWFGKSHPLVADVLFALAQIMGNAMNDRGFDKVASESVYRRALGIREEFFGTNHISVSDTLFELGKLLKDEISFAAKNEALKLLRRALDIRITNLGGEHIDTRAVRTYLSKLEVSLKMGKYEFGPAKPTDVRTTERPYSNMSWRDKDISNFEKRAKSRASSMSSSATNSRPTSSKLDMYGVTSSSRLSSASFRCASEKLMIDSDRPRLLQREKADRKLRASSSKSSHLSPDDTMESKKYVTVELKMSEQEDEGPVEIRVAEPQIDSFGEEIGQMDRPIAKVQKQVKMDTDVGPVHLYNRYGSAGSSRSATSSRDKFQTRTGSAKSQNSHITSNSRMSRTTLASSRSRSSATSAHAISPSTTRSVTIGPNCDIASLLGPPQSPRDISRGIHHRSAWYHVPGRYGTVDKRVPPKRSQRTHDAQAYERFLANTGPNTAQKKKYSQSKFAKFQQPGVRRNNYENAEGDADNFGPTVKGIGPYNGYHDDYYLDNGVPEFQTNQGASVTFKEAVIVD